MPDFRNLALTLSNDPDPQKFEVALNEAFEAGASVRHAECSHGFGYGLKVGLGVVPKISETVDNGGTCAAKEVGATLNKSTSDDAEN